MGVFSLAGTHTTIISHADGHQPFKITISPDAWSGRAVIPISMDGEAASHPTGTTIIFRASENDLRSLAGVVSTVAKFYPAAVFLNDEPVEQASWLAGAAHVEEAMGLQIGVFKRFGFNSIARENSINFHGLQIGAREIPSVQEIKRYDTGKYGEPTHWTVKVNVVDCPELQLVLPARKELVQTEFLATFTQLCFQAIYRAIQREGGDHTLPFKNWQQAKDFGIHLPEARNVLRAWEPMLADSSSTAEAHYDFSFPADGSPIIIETVTPAIDHNIARALHQNGGKRGIIAFDAICEFEGYSWYDAIPNIIDADYEATLGDEKFSSIETILDAYSAGGKDGFDALHLKLKVQDGAVDPDLVFPTDLLLPHDEICGVDDILLILTKDSKPTVEVLTDIITDAYFSSSDDIENDSYQTQLDYWLSETREMLIRTLKGGHAAAVDTIINTFMEKLKWAVPAGHKLVLTFDKDTDNLQVDVIGARRPGRGNVSFPAKLRA